MSDLLTPVNNDQMVKQEEVKPLVENISQEIIQEPVKEVMQESIELPKQPEVKQEDEFASLPEGLRELAALANEKDNGAIKTMEERQEEINKQANMKDLLKDIVVDLTSIQISDNSLMGIRRAENAFKNKKVTQIVACQSAYKAFMSALNNQEIQNLTGSDEDYYSYKKRLMKLIFKHMEDTSIGKLTFADFSKLTSFFDVDTLLYGIYTQTFPYENKYNIQCPKSECRHHYTTTVNNNTLIEVRGKDGIFDQINTIISEVKDPQSAIEKSLVQKTKRILCTESKVIVDVRIPSVHDYLEGILSKVDPKFSEEYSTSLGLALFIKKMYIPDLITLQETGKLTYIEIEDSKKIVEMIAELSFVDAEQLSNDINEFTEKYKISYTLKNVTCPECGHVIKEIPMDMETLMFHTIHTIRQGKTETK